MGDVAYPNDFHK